MGANYRYAFGTYAFLENGNENSDMSQGFAALENLAREHRAVIENEGSASTGTNETQISSLPRGMESIKILSLGEVLHARCSVEDDDM